MIEKRKGSCDYCGKQTVYVKMFRRSDALICCYCMMRILKEREQFHKAQPCNKQMVSKIS